MGDFDAGQADVCDDSLIDPPPLELEARRPCLQG